jgi:anti-sigma factor RsiW
MICLRDNERGADLLIGYLEGTLSSADRAELDRHAAVCAECRGLLAVQRELDQYPAPEVSPDFDARLYARIDREKASSWRSLLRRLLWRPMAPLAAAAALAVVLIVRTQVPGEAPVEKAANDPQLELVEQALEDMELLMPL